MQMSRTCTNTAWRRFVSAGPLDLEIFIFADGADEIFAKSEKDVDVMELKKVNGPGVCLALDNIY